jgi:hypothetical protein
MGRPTYLFAGIVAGALLISGLAYSLNRGIYIGSTIHQYPETRWSSGYTQMTCTYLFASGTAVFDALNGRLNGEEANPGGFCPFYFR